MLHACQFMLCMDYESEIKIYYLLLLYLVIYLKTTFTKSAPFPAHKVDAIIIVISVRYVEETN